MISKTKLIVRYQETDQMGIVHHSVYPIWFECGRTDFIKKAGLSYSQMEKEGVKLPLRSLRCNYYHPSYFEDEIVIKTGISYLTPTRIVFSYEVYRKGFLKPIVTGETEHVWVNKDLKPVNMKKYRPELYNLISAIFNEEGCV
ncbi:thioesterase superfamily protein [Thermoclostridium stercorarium subsp. stercorarium DSM 8532]|jgi:acyl-CoA thioester hydrolase|uniref:Thioesterase superfamily protein n=3 Tax=Thermoclostridium stercorarium TaxID=1510 RepID=L7VNW5_THES1|nr:thioesterase family protein [Thermoclostridium stercorarium]AGC68477.1 thioesterase superfamily protein [Thermoclostridium stercorarium subsp. stercorarium DSM 8532]AGI39495.1 acyl-CoA thioester hydrolase [Thermoclostridium stercorarium subsp. stercorarium DSM 8532]ANW98840.1 4-hydroxybenzoyl-CoA thioesterase [Thermoclostridium stercorarium subsp. thermolacticum DSM 2910]ANX01365.1 4-hydroxybenzoyl-CoA thioesterase [Thermoclostridium stercorarium subsp. leptospartum DSM 9219]